jgi:hypothetical protein
MQGNHKTKGKKKKKYCGSLKPLVYYYLFFLLTKIGFSSTIVGKGLTARITAAQKICLAAKLQKSFKKLQLLINQKGLYFIHHQMYWFIAKFQ